MSDLPARTGVPAPAAAMRTAFPAPVRAGLGWLFRHVRLAEEDQRTLDDLAERGTVVYVSRTAGLLPYLALNWLCLRLRLPLAHYVNGVRPLVARLFGRGLSAGGPGADDAVADEAHLSRTVAAGHSALVFLWRRARALSGKKDSFPSDHAAALVRLQQESERPVFLVPVLLLYGRDRGTKDARPRLIDILFGPREAPGRLRALTSFLRFRRTARLQVGEPIDLRAVIAEEDDPRPAVLGRKIRGVLAQYLARAERAVTGPARKSPARMRLEVLRDRRLRETLTQVAEESGRPSKSVFAEADRDLREIAARLNPTVLATMASFFTFFFNRIYDGIWVDQEGIDRLTRAAHRGPLVLCPSHRSHIDYLVLSWVMHQQGLRAPHIAAGRNLSFWPAGPILRRCGAFFMRRSFREDRIYSAVFRAYVKRLLHEGHPQEFFIEGTRSRTGKSLMPKTGLLSYEVSAFLEGTRTDAVLVPISIGYTRVIEGRAYRKELLGGEKSAEDVSGLIEARKVLRTRWGRIYIQVEEPISLVDFMADHGFDRERYDEAELRSLVERLARRIIWGIDRVTTVTPTVLVAGALLTDRRRGMELSELQERATFLADYLGRDGDARVSDTVRYDQEGRLEVEPLREAALTLAGEGHLRVHGLGERTIIEIDPEGRLGLDFYKNALIPYFAARSLVAQTLLSFSATADAPPTVSLTGLKMRVLDLAEVLADEFVFHPDRGLAAELDEVLDELTADGCIEPAGRKNREGRASAVRVTATGSGPLALLRLLTLSLVEGYWVTVSTVASLSVGQSVSRKDLVTSVLEEGRALSLTGRIAAAEAVSKPIVQAALAMLAGRGVLCEVGAKHDGLELGDLEELARIREVLTPFLGLPDVQPLPRLPR